MRTLGTVGLVSNFSLAAYHFLARGDDSWLGDERFQVVILAPLGAGPVHLLSCPRCSYDIALQAWDNRGFLCPEHGVALIRSPGVQSPRVGPGKTSPVGLTTVAYLEDVASIETLVQECPGWEAGLSMRIPQVLPFSEWIIGLGGVPSMPSLVDFVRDWLRQSALSCPGAEVREIEEKLADTYNKFLGTLYLTACPGTHD